MMPPLVRSAKELIRPLQRHVLFPLRHLVELRKWQAHRRGPVIVIYHGVEPAVVDRRMQPFCLSPDQFRNSLQVILEHHQVVALDEIIDAFGRGEPLSRRWAALTFDDGYLNNLTVVQPILHEFGDLPATIFACPGLSQRGEWLSYTEIRLCVLFHPEDRVEVPALNSVLELGPPRGRVHVLAKLLKHMALQPFHKPVELAKQLVAGMPPDVYSRLKQRFRSEQLMTPEQLRELARFPNIQIASHTMNHASLHDRQSPEVLEGEIKNCRGILEGWLQKPVHHFAYPGGVHCPAAVKAAADAGYSSAFTVQPGEIVSGANPYLLPRLSSSPYPVVQRRTLACAGMNGAQGWWF